VCSSGVCENTSVQWEHIIGKPSVSCAAAFSGVHPCHPCHPCHSCCASIGCGDLIDDPNPIRSCPMFLGSCSCFCFFACVGPDPCPSLFCPVPPCERESLPDCSVEGNENENCVCSQPVLSLVFAPWSVCADSGDISIGYVAWLMHDIAVQVSSPKLMVFAGPASTGPIPFFEIEWSSWSGSSLRTSHDVMRVTNAS
jgi:hypothetical protein